MAGVRAFREGYFDASIEPSDVADFDSLDARLVRYEVFWAFYQNNAYRDIHAWATAMRKQYGLYKYIRNIYNPALRLGNFWQTHLAGGMLDAAAGDGRSRPSALPVITENENLRPAIARLWRDSLWQINKDIWTLQGSVLGDCALRIVDDLQRRKVYLSVQHPSTISDVELDPFGNVKGYTIDEQREDPRNDSGNYVTYTEVAYRDGIYVVYETYLNGSPYGWDDNPEMWAEPYGFVPLVITKHNDVGKTWGWSEMYPDLSKVREVDDISSKLSDQIRKNVDALWLLSGVEDPRRTLKPKGTAPTGDKPESGREELPAIYASNADAKATPLVANLNIADALAHIKEISAELERDYPELRMDIWTASGDASGRALRTARQASESKVQARRINYDHALQRAQAMGVAIGGFRGYDGYAGFGLDSYESGALEHAIGERSVFRSDPLDDIEMDAAFWTAAKAAEDAGMPIDVYLERKGWDQQTIERITSSELYLQKITAGTFG